MTSSRNDSNSMQNLRTKLKKDKRVTGIKRASMALFAVAVVAVAAFGINSANLQQAKVQPISTVDSETTSETHEYALNIRNEYIKIGENLQLQITDNGTDVGTSGWTFSSSNDDVASISSTGKITGLSMGYTTIVCKNTSNDSKLKAIVNVYRNVTGAVTRPQVEEGEGFTAILKEDGTVWTTGLNNYGQLGNGTTTNSNILQQVKIDENTYLTNVRKISIGVNSAVAMTSDGKAYSWGYNGNGCLGLGDTTNRSYATQMKGKNGEKYIDNVVDIASNFYDTCILKSDGTVLGTGYNQYGDINTDCTSKTTLTEIPVFKNAIKIDIYQSTVAILQNSDVLIKGYNGNGQFGNGAVARNGGEYKIGNDINDIDAHGCNTAILKEDDTVWTVGYNGYGQLGLGDGTERHTFTKVQYNGEDFKAKYLKGIGFSLIITGKDNKVYYTGCNTNGQSTNGNTNSVVSPIVMKLVDDTEVKNAIDISVNDSSTAVTSDSSIIKDDGTVWVIGDNTYGQFGNKTNTSANVLTQVGETEAELNIRNEYIKIGDTIDANILKATQFNTFIQNVKLSDFEWSSSNDDVATVDSNGKITGKSIGQTTIIAKNKVNGIKAKAIVNVYRNIQGAVTRPQVQEGEGFTTILKEDGTVWTAGRNSEGELGNGTTTNSNTLVQVKIDENTYLTNVRKISTGNYSNMAMTADGKVYTWGWNKYGQLGQGDATDRSYATQVKINGSLVEDAIDIHLKYIDSYILRKDGTVYGAGENGAGAVNSDNVARTSYTEVERSKNAIMIRGDYAYSIVIKANGETRIKGHNLYGAFGNGTTAQNGGEYVIGNDVNDIGAYGYSLGLIKEDGTLWTSGGNGYGQLGLGDTTNRTTFTKVQYNGEDLKTKYVYGSSYSSIVIGKDNKAYFMGYNGYGQSTNKETTSVTSPTIMKWSDGTEVSNILCASTTNSWYSNVSLNSILIKNDGTVWGIGDNTYGQLGDETNTARNYLTQVGEIEAELNIRNEYIKIGDTIDANVLKAYQFNVLIQKISQSSFEWSSSNDDVATIDSNGIITGKSIGQTTIIAKNKVNGIKAKAIVNVYRNVQGAVTRPQVSEGDEFTAVLKEDGTVWTSGRNDYGQLGKGTTNSNTLGQVKIDENTYLTNVRKIASGTYFSIAMTADGKVYTWGYNQEGELGQGDTTNRLYATQAKIDNSYINDAVDIECIHSGTFILRKNGKIYGAGHNNCGAINSDKAIRKNYTEIDGLKNAIMIRGGYNEYVSVIKSNGETKIKGTNSTGGFGNGSTTSECSEYVIGNDINDICGYGYSTAIIKEDETVWTTGRNQYGQLGIGDTTDRTTYTKVQYNGEDFKAKYLCGGAYSNIVIGKDNKAYFMGQNGYGQSTNGTTANVTSPIIMKYADGSEVKDIINARTSNNVWNGNSSDSVIIKNDGTVWAIGDNTYGQFGDGTNTSRNVLTQVGQTEAELNIRNEYIKIGDTINAKVLNSKAFNVLIGDGSENNSWTWSSSNEDVATVDENGIITGKSIGQTTIIAKNKVNGIKAKAIVNVYRNVQGAVTRPQVSEGEGFTAILKEDGTVWTAGRNEHGELGNGTTTNSNTLGQVKIDENTYLTNVRKIASGPYFSIAMTADGKVYTWGYNQEGELGQGDTTNRLYATQAKIDNSYINDAVDIECIHSGTYILRKDGKVYGAGHNNCGAINSDKAIRKNYTEIDGLKNAIMIRGGYNEYVSVIKSNGETKIKGTNSTGGFGNGSTTSECSEYVIGNDVNDINPYGYSTAIIKEDETIWTTGGNGYGQLGLGDTTNRTTFTKVQYNGEDLKAKYIFGGSYSNIIVGKDNKAYFMGYNGYGQSTNKETTNVTSPTIMKWSDGTEVSNILGASTTNSWYSNVSLDSILIKEDGTVWLIGDNTYGQLAQGDNTSRNVLTEIGGSAAFSPIKYDYEIGVNETTNINVDNFLYENNFNVFVDGGETIGTLKYESLDPAIATVDVDTGKVLGVSEGITKVKITNTLNSDSTYVLIRVKGGDFIPQVSGGYNHTLALKQNGTVWSFGSNEFGQLGNKDISGSSPKPIQVFKEDGTALTNIKQISAGYYHSVALTKEGEVYTWGKNSYGELGLQNNTNVSTPTKVEINATIEKVVAFEYRTLALDSDGNIWTWGQGYSNTPTKITVTEKATDITGTLYLTSDKRVHNLTDETVINGLENVVKLSTNYGTSNYALRADGKVYAWGDNRNGQLGDNTTTNKTIPSYVLSTDGSNNLSDIIDVTSGTYSAIAQDINGNIYTWGYNGYGELGDGSNTTSKLPIKIEKLSNIESIGESDGYHSVVTDKDGFVYTTGLNDKGQLGDETTTNKNEFVKIGTPYLKTDKNTISLNVGNTDTIEAKALYGFNLKKDEIDTPLTYKILDENVSKINGSKTVTNTTAKNTISGEAEGRTQLVISASDYDISKTVGIEVLPEGAKCIADVKSGNDFTVALRSSGEVYTWGSNDYGNLGLGDTARRDEPTKVEAITEIAKGISVEDNHALVLNENGEVYAFGYNGYGQLGNGGTSNLSTPTKVKAIINGQVTTLNNIINIKAGKNVSFAIDNDFNLWAWGQGFNRYAQKVSGFDNVLDVTKDYVLKSDEKVYKISDGTEVSTEKKVKALDEGYDHTVMLAEDNTAYAIGKNTYGQLGNGTYTDSDIVVAIRTTDGSNIVTNVKAVKAGKYNTILITNDNKVYTVGSNENGKNGLDFSENTDTTGSTTASTNNEDSTSNTTSTGSTNSATTNSTSNVNGVSTINGIESTNLIKECTKVSDPKIIAAGYNHTEIAKQDGFVYDFGKGTRGQLGNRKEEDSKDAVIAGNYKITSNVGKVRLSINGTKKTDIKANYFNLYKDCTDKIVYTMNDTSIASIDDEGTITGKAKGKTILKAQIENRDEKLLIPVQVMDKNEVAIPMVRTNSSHAIILKANGTVYGIGQNAYGELGDGSQETKDGAVKVGFDSSVKIVEIDAGENHNIALDLTGKVYTWGRNNYGQLGTGDQIATKPVEVTLPEAIVKVAAGNNTSFAIGESGNVYAWGYNQNGELGIGTYRSITTPTKVPNIEGAIDIAGGNNHTVLLTNEGKVYTTGRNTYGQLGYELESDKTNKFNQVSGLSEIADVEAGYTHNVALTLSGEIYEWGGNIYGQLGLGDRDNRKTPVKVDGISNISDISAGKGNTMLLSNDGTISLAGANNEGEIGDGTTKEKSTFTNVSKLQNAISISTGRTYSLAILSDGSVWAWGDYNHGDTSKVSKTNSEVPVKIATDLSLIQESEIVLKQSDTETLRVNEKYEFNVYEDTNKQASDFKYESLNSDIAEVNEDGTILGKRIGTTRVIATEKATNEKIEAIVKVINNTGIAAPEVEGGNNFAVSLKNDGTLYTWGENSSLTDNTDYNSSLIPEKMNIVSTYQKISVGKNHALALRKDGTVWAYGDNSKGELGTESLDDSAKFVQVHNIDKAKLIAAGDNFSVVVDEYGRIYGFGDNSNNQLGDKIDNYTTTPTLIAAPEDSVMNISAGEGEVAYITTEGEVYGLGKVLNGKLSGIENALKVEVGNGYILILTKDGALYEYKDRTLTEISSNNIVDIYAKDNVRMYQDKDEKVYIWGNNDNGKLGTNDETYKSSPTLAYQNDDSLFGMGAGYNNTYLIKNNGLVYASGENDKGSIGNGQKENSNKHILVGDRNFSVEPTSKEMIVNDEEDLNLSTKSYNVFNLDTLDESQYTISDLNPDIVSLTDLKLKALSEGTAKIQIADNLTGVTKEITRVVIPIEELRFDTLTVNDTKAEITGSKKYQVTIVSDDNTATLKIVTKDSTDKISIDGGTTYTETGTLTKNIDVTEKETTIPIKVQISNGTVLDYELTVIRKSANAKLQDITVNGNNATLSTKESNTYETIVEDNVDKLDIIATSEDDNAKVQIADGEEKTKQAENANEKLDDTYKTYTIKVTSEGGIVKNYTLKVFKKSALLELENVKVDDNDANKESDTEYTYEIESDATTALVYAKAKYEDSYVSINGSDYVKAENTVSIDTSSMAEKETKEISIKVKYSENSSDTTTDNTGTTTTATDNTTTDSIKEYTLKITKKEKAAEPTYDATLSKVTINGVKVAKEDGKDEYDVELADAVNKVTVVATTTDENASVYIDEGEYVLHEATKEITISAENTDVPIVVKAEDGTTKIYTLKIKGLPDNTNVDITLDDEEATYDTANAKYIVKLNKNKDTHTLKAVLDDSKAKIKLGTNEEKQSSDEMTVTNDMVGKQIIATITAQNGTTEDVIIEIQEKSSETGIEYVKYNTTITTTSSNSNSNESANEGSKETTNNTNNTTSGTTENTTESTTSDYQTVVADSNGNYTIYINENVNSVGLDIKAVDSIETIKLNDVTSTNELTTEIDTTDLTVYSPSKDLTFTVTAEDGTVSSHKITIYKMNNNTNLKTLKVDDTEITADADGVFRYVISRKDTAKIEAEAENTKSVVTINGEANTTSTASIETKIPSEENTESILITAEDGSTKVYTLVIRKISNDTSIKSLKLDGRDETIELTGDGTYGVTVPYGLDKVTLIGETTSQYAKIKLSSEEDTSYETSTMTRDIDLTDFTTEVKIKVKAEDGTEKESTLTIIKDHSISLESLTKDDTEMNYSESKDAYIAYYDVDTSTATIKATAQDSTTTVAIMLGDETLASGTGTVEKTVTTTADNINLNVKLTTSTGNKSKVYKVKLARISQDNSIEYLKLSGTEIKETDGKYSIVADRADTYSLNIKPTNEYAQIKLDDGDYNTAGEITKTINMTNTETKDITITVKSQNGSEREYTLSIRKKSNDVSLKALSTTEQSISQIEDENTVFVDRDLASTKVSATVNSEYSKVKIATEDETADDIEYTETSAEKEITISSDKEETDAKVYVEAENGDTKIYTVKIIKKSNNNNLSEITFNNEKAVLDETDNKYKLNIVDTITSGNIYVKAENEYATIKINNDLTEKQSENTIAVDVNSTDKVQEFPIKITAQDGEEKDYTLQLTRLNNDYSVKDVKVNTYEADEQENVYTKVVAEGTTSVDLSIEANNENSTITLGNNSSKGTLTQTVELNSIVQDYEFTVTSEYGQTQTYKVRVRKQSSESNLKEVTVNGITATKDSDGNYRVSVLDSVTIGNVVATANNEYAKVKVGEGTEATKTASGSVVLEEKETDEIITVTTETGVVSQTVLIITKVSNDTGVELVTVDDNDVENYDANTKTYSIILNSIKEKYTLGILTKNKYAKVIFGNTKVTNQLNTEIEVEDENGKTLEFTIEAENGEQTTYKLIIGKVSNDANVSIIKVNDLEVEPTTSTSNIYEKEIPKEAVKAKIYVKSEYQYATIQIADTDKKIGESETEITLDLDEDKFTIPVVITATDGTTVNTYNIVLTRDTGIYISGKITTENVEGKYVSNVKIYRESDNELVADSNTNEDGTFKQLIYKEGVTEKIDEDKDGVADQLKDKYKVVVTKDGYLTYTVTDVELPSYETKLDEYKLIAGDTVSDDEIEIDDLTDLNDNIGVVITDENKSEKSIYDLNEDGTIDKLDRNILKKNYGKKAKTVKWVNPENGLIKPITTEYVITSKYGMRKNPVTGETKLHSGIDIVGEHHTPIIAVADGEITYAGVQNGYGNCVEIKHTVNGKTLYSFYGHLSRIDVKVGDTVTQAQTIGLEGGASTDENHGTSTGHHLHFEIRTASGSGHSVDPTNYIEF